MSKFRARALDASKPMPIFRSDELPDLPDFAAINRAVPQMPSGMEKEEECEHHLQRAMSAQQAYGQTGDLVIPTPEVYECTCSYEQLYPEDARIPRQFIHMQPSAMEQDIPDYDMDSEDEKWVLQQAKKMDVTPLQFEEMMDRLEKGSGQQVVSWKEAKSLLKEDDDLITAVYDYWLNKRLRMQHALIPQVKTEKRDGSTNNNPYVAFRRRTEKMQTRKNRKNDEASYEKMLKLRRDLSRAVTLIEMVKRREKAKREHLHLNIEVFEKRYQANDFNGQILAEVSAFRNNTRPSYVSVHNSSNQYTVSRQPEWSNRVTKAEVPVSRKKREYKKRKHKDGQQTAGVMASLKYVDVDGSFGLSSDEEVTVGPLPAEREFENDPDGHFAFRRKKNCSYHAPITEGLGNWPWCSSEDGGLADRKYRFCLTSLSVPRSRCIGFARRRIGRGGRCLIDRACSPLDEWWPDLDCLCHVSQPNMPNGLQQSTNELLTEIRNEWLHFRPQTPPPCVVDSPVDRDVALGPSIGHGEQRTVGCTFHGVSSQSCTHNGEAVSCCDDGDNSDSRDEETELSIESFQSHQEELMEMQRRQRECLEQDEASHCRGSSGMSQSSSRFMVDSASAQFAVSAVITTKKVPGNPSALTTAHASPRAALTAMAHPGACNSSQINGPAVAAATVAPSNPCNAGGGGGGGIAPSSKFAALTSSASILSASSSLASSHSLSCVSSPMNIFPSKSVPPKLGHDLKVGQVASMETVIDSGETLARGDSKVTVEPLLNENSVPMEVT